MTSFVTTTDGKIVNLNAIAYITWRLHPSAKVQTEKKGSQVSFVRKDIPKQLVIGFSAIATSKENLLPLCLFLQGEEAEDFLNQLESAGLNVEKLRDKVAVPEPPSAPEPEADSE